MDTSYERAGENSKDEWLTPPYIIKALGEFDLDPCAPIDRPWDMAKKHYNLLDDGLKQEWEGRVWCNPPYGTQAGAWLKKLAEHGNGIALIFARTETAVFFETIWSKADAIMFIKGRLRFHHVTGEVAKQSAGTSSCLVAYGQNNVEALWNNTLKGVVLQLNDGIRKEAEIALLP